MGAALSACDPVSHRIPNPDGAAGEPAEEPETTPAPAIPEAAGSGGTGEVLAPCTTGGSVGVGHGASGGSGGSAGSGEAGTPAGGSSRTREATCARWIGDRANLDEGIWTGSVERCDPGDTGEDAVEDALRMVNLYRWLAELPPVTTTPERNRIAQSCALMQHANWQRSGLQHEPPRSWECYSEDGATGSLTSNISGAPGVTSVGAYMLDLGNEEDLGHRRIVLANFLGPIGLGSTGRGGASCMQALPGSGDAGKAWMAWPPPGPFPSSAYSYASYSLDTTGWSIQSEALDLSRARVFVQVNGRDVPVRVHDLHGRYGSTSAIRIVPSGWSARVGETIAVTVSGASVPIQYEFELVDC